MRFIHRVQPLLLSAVILLIIGLSGCAQAASPARTDDIAWLKKGGNITVRFSTESTLSFDGYHNGTTWTGPVVLSVPAVPIQWNGNIFNGAAEDKTSAGGRLFDKVFGSVSSDGQWLNELTYSRDAKTSAQGGGSYFQVSLRNIPITRLVNSNSTLLSSFTMSGEDIQKYVSNIEYFSGDPVTKYVSTNWTEANGVLSLKVELATGKGNRNVGVPTEGCFVVN